MPYFDLQINGYVGVDFCSGGLDGESMARACEALEADGVGGILATVITDRIDSLCEKLRAMVRFREQDERICRVVRGFHVEGPFLNASPGYIGAHPPDCVVPATPDAAARLLEAGAGLVRLVTLAPENDAGAATVRRLVGEGVTVSAGHCDPDLATLERAIDAGLSMVTHLGNGCPVDLPRHDNFIQRVLSLSDRLWVCYIADGFHVPFFALRNYYRITGPERTIFTTDAITAAGLGPGVYDLSGEPVEVDEQGVARRPGSPNLAGSTIRGHRLAANLREQLGLDEAGIDRVYRANPMRALGLE